MADQHVEKLLRHSTAEGAPAPITGQLLEQYTEELCRGGASFSKLLGVPEMCYFLHVVLGVDLDKDALASPLVKGRLRRANLMKPARNQASPLGVRDVQALESFLANKDHRCVDRFVVGAFLFAVYARARLGDLKSVSAVTLDFRRKGNGAVQSGYLELKSYSHKARSARSARGYDLPLVAPIQGVGQGLWGVHLWKLLWKLTATWRPWRTSRRL